MHRRRTCASWVQVINMNCCNLVQLLSLVNDVFMPDVPEYYHDYRLVHMEHSDKVIDGLRFIFVELPKFTPKTFSEKKMHVLWLRYLTEINEIIRKVSEDLLEAPEITRRWS